MFGALWSRASTCYNLMLLTTLTTVVSWLNDDDDGPIAHTLKAKSNNIKAFFFFHNGPIIECMYSSI